MSKTLSEKVDFALSCISECCVSESKMHISSEDAIEKIREYLEILNDPEYDENFNIGLLAELKKKDREIAVLKRALDLAVKRVLNDEFGMTDRHYDTSTIESFTERFFDSEFKDFITQAKKELGGIDE